MGEWGQTAKLLKLSKSDISIWLMTFALTVLADLTVAVEFGMILAALLFIRKVTVTTTVSVVTDHYVEAGRAHSLQDKEIPDYVKIFASTDLFFSAQPRNCSSLPRTSTRCHPWSYYGFAT